MSTQHDWALGKRVRHEDGRTGRIVEIDDADPQNPYLIMRQDTVDDEPRELVAHCRNFEVIA